MDHFTETPMHVRFARNVREAMKEQGLSMRTAAPKCGVSFVHLNRILCFHVDPSLSVCWQIAAALSSRPLEMFE
jgi:transcriptional regulator with XRE-family HTH domain